MAQNTYNRVSAHADLSPLTSLEKLVFKEIAARLNNSNAALMKLGVRFLARALAASERQTAKAIKRLEALGYINSYQPNGRTGRVFSVLVDCPADCKKKDKHYSKAEKKALIAADRELSSVELLTAECVLLEPSSVELLTAECGTEVHTNKELNKEINKELNTREIDPVTDTETEAFSVYVSLAQFTKTCSDTIGKLSPGELTEAHKVIAANPANYYQRANQFIADKVNAGNEIAKPAAYLARVIAASPETFTAAALAASTQKDLAGLNDWITSQLRNKFEFLDDTGAVRYNTRLLASEINKQPEAAKWLEDCSRLGYGSVSGAEFSSVAWRVINADPAAYEQLNTAYSA